MKFMQKQARPRYDAERIEQEYRQSPFLVMRRLLTLIWVLGGFFLRLKVDQWRGVEEKNKYRRAKELRELLTKLGPTYIKVGQALSTRPDLVRKDFLEELSKLQDQLPPFDSVIAFQIIEQELQRPIKEVYREISPQPVAAASLGQVYRAVLYSGEEVAVKVQRPNLEPILTLDLYIMRWGITKIQSFLPLNLGHDLTLIIDEFGTKLFEEIDYLNEGQNAEKFALNFQNESSVKVPKIYWDYSSYCVLTLEWINGFKLTDTNKIKAANLEQNELVEIGVVAGLRQLLEHGFFHADPHPGNLFAMPDGRMAYIDFGMMDQLEEETKETIASSVVHLLNRDYERLAEDFIFLGFPA
jgi:predicted unusual protein kinase regulating ubiquinone biosynthesis (AarF/ABC1/UbiB family)